MDGVRAWEELHDPVRSARLTMGEIEDLMVRAGYSLREAHAAAMQRGWDRLAAGEVM